MFLLLFVIVLCNIELKNKDTIDNDTIVEGSYGNEVIIEKEETKSSDMLNYKAEGKAQTLRVS